VIVFEDLQIANLVKRPKVKQDEETGQYLPNGAAAKGRLTKSMLDAGWGMFVAMCSCKAAGAGRTLLKVNPQYTSQICSACGKSRNYVDTLQDVYIMVVDVDILLRGTLNNPQKRCPHNNKKTLEERWHSCECGAEMDRDFNAARNILVLGQQHLGGKRPTSATA